MEQDIFLFFYFFALMVLAGFGLHKYFLLHTCRKYENFTEKNTRIPEEWPEVTVQLPIFNERYVLKRLIKSIVDFDYPKEKLNIQILDDSNDDTRKLAARFTRALKRKGFHIEHLRRESRRGFKAGALAFGLNRTSSEFLAVFDADFAPNPDFLKKTIPHLLANPEVGMVQARWGHLNRDSSLLTKLQAIFLDAHFLIEHVARYRSGRFFNFNGTAGVWRRQAIAAAGGWQHDTLTEDLDLSYRAQLAGWKFIYLPDVVAPAELPVDMNAYKSQQHRWAKGSVQTALKLIPSIWQANLPFKIKFEAVIHLCNNFAYLLMAIPSFLIIPVVKFQIEMRLWWPIFVYIFMFFAATFSVIVYYSVTLRKSRGKLWPTVLYLPLLISLGIGLSINNGRAAVEALLGKQSEFKRTPKYNLDGNRKKRKRRGYKTKIVYFYLLELLFAFYFTYGMIYFIIQGYYFSLPFFLLFQIGFLYLALSSVTNQFNFSFQSGKK